MSKEKGKIETVEVTLKLPKAIVDFYKEDEQPVEERLVWELVEKAFGQVESMDADAIMDRFNLKPVFKKFEVLPGYYEKGEAK